LFSYRNSALGGCNFRSDSVAVVNEKNTGTYENDLDQKKVADAAKDGTVGTVSETVYSTVQPTATPEKS